MFGCRRRRRRRGGQSSGLSAAWWAAKNRRLLVAAAVKRRIHRPSRRLFGCQRPFGRLGRPERVGRMRSTTVTTLLIAAVWLLPAYLAALQQHPASDSVSLGTVESVQLREIDDDQLHRMTTIELSDDGSWRVDRAASSITKKLVGAIQVFCLETHMVVTIAKAAVLEFGVRRAEQIAFIKDNEELCGQSEEYSNQTHFIFGTYYAACDTETVRLADREEYVSRIFIRNNASISSMGADTIRLAQKLNLLQLEASVLQVRCVRLDRPPRLANGQPPLAVISASETNNHSFVLQMYDNQWFSNPWIKFPHVLRIGRRVFVDVLVKSQSISQPDVGLRPLLKECFFTRNSSPRSQTRHVLIATGCPMDTSVMVHYPKLRSAAHSSRFSFEPRQFYFPGSFMFLHCHVTLCAWNSSTLPPTGAHRQSTGVVQCPDGLHCNDLNAAADRPMATLQPEVVAAQDHYVSSGPLHPVIIDDDPEKSDASRHKIRLGAADSRKTLQPNYGPCDSDVQFPMEAANTVHSDRITVVKGLGTGSVVAISSAAFVVGMMLVGGMWYIYELTSKKETTGAAQRLMNGHRFQKSYVCSSSESSTLPTACLTTATDTL